MKLTVEENVEIASLLLVLSKVTPNKTVKDRAAKMAERLMELYVAS